MIKNEAQLRQAQERLEVLRVERERLRAQYGDSVPAHLLSQLSEDKRRVDAEIGEYLSLRQLPLVDAVALLAQNPVLVENIGELLAKLRIAAKLTQEQLAQQLGWEQSNVSRFESNSYSSQTIGKVAEYLDGIGVWLYVTPALSPKTDKSTYSIVNASIGQTFFRGESQPITGFTENALFKENPALELAAAPAKP